MDENVNAGAYGRAMTTHLDRAYDHSDRLFTILMDMCHDHRISPGIRAEYRLRLREALQASMDELEP